MDAVSRHDEIAGAIVRAVLPFEHPRFPTVDPEYILRRMNAIFKVEDDRQLAAALMLFNSIASFENPPKQLIEQNTGLYGKTDLEGDRHLFESWARGVKNQRDYFTELDLGDQRSYLALWSRSSLGVRRRLYQTLKTLVVATAYSTAALWRTIGYEGPLVQRVARL
jgi:hypothetical protein